LINPPATAGGTDLNYRDLLAQNALTE
jgi:hypothetical protein